MEGEHDSAHSKLLQDCCHLNGKEFFVPEEKLREYKIIVTTMFTAKR